MEIAPGDLLDHDEVWRELCKKHEGWKERMRSESAYYAIPQQILEELRSSNQISEQEFDGETCFTLICARYNAVGAIQGAFVPCGYITRVPLDTISISDSECKLLGWNDLTPEKFKDNVADYENYGSRVNKRITAYVGWLLTNPMFNRERDLLRKVYLKRGGSPRFPLTAGLSSVEGFNTDLLSFCRRWGLDAIDSQKVRCEMKSLFEKTLKTNRELACDTEVVLFLTRWGLAGMATWELPLPQGPIDGGSAYAVTSLVNHPDNVGRTMFIPYWYGVIDSSDDLLERLRREQAAQGMAKMDGYEPRAIKGNGWPVAHIDVFFNIFYTLFYRNAVKQRWNFRKGSRLSGAVQRGLSRFFGKTPPSTVSKSHGSLTSKETVAVRLYSSYIDKLLNGEVPPKLRNKTR